MCTVSFIPKNGGYLVAMNRDELFTRGAAELPEVRFIEGVQTAYPRDASGGTWIATNELGNTWALLNWNIEPHCPRPRSRGEVILLTLPSPSIDAAHELLLGSSLQGIGPFRLIGIFAQQKTIREWRWDGTRLDSIEHPWAVNHWFSSGRSDELAARQRTSQLDDAWHSNDAGSLAWLRRQHESHTPEAGAFSICVHRDDAATLSYTEIDVGVEHIRLRYKNAAPCQQQEFDTKLTLARRPSK